MIQTIVSRADWIGPDLVRSDAWIQVLNRSEKDELHAALRHVKGTGKRLLEITRDDFPLGRLGGSLTAMRDADLETGLGLKLIRGVPVADYEIDDLRMIYWGIGTHLGVALPQGKDSELLGDVRDVGNDYKSLTGRGYTSNADLKFHTDFCDVVSLFCLRTAKHGGELRVASAVALHNEIQRRRPDLLEELYKPFHFSRQGDEAPEEKPFYAAPVFGVRDGAFAVRYVRNHIEFGQHFPEVPRLSDRQRAALDLIDSIVSQPDFYCRMTFEPGDIQWLNNHLLLHSRTQFEDFPEAERKRHLLRLWLATPSSRPLIAGWEECCKSVEPGTVRGGIKGRGSDAAADAYRARVARSLGMVVPAAVLTSASVREQQGADVR